MERIAPDIARFQPDLNAQQRDEFMGYYKQFIGDLNRFKLSAEGHSVLFSENLVKVDRCRLP